MLTFSLVLLAGALLLITILLLLDWLMNGTCTWCGNGPATLGHYLDEHTDDHAKRAGGHQ